MMKKKVKMMTKIDFEKLFSVSLSGENGSQRLLDIDSILKIYYGLNNEGCFRLAFCSSINPPKIESTKQMKVTQGEEKNGVWWTCFDLLKQDASAAFFAFCQNIVEAVINASGETDALYRLKKRYICWKTLFKNESKTSLPKETIQGLFGELYFLESVMVNIYGYKDSIYGWGGPDATSKDFVIDNNWYEVKTIGTSSPTVKISSLAQLSSSIPGHLVIIRVEQMPTAFSNGKSSILELITLLLSQIDDEGLENLLLSKISSYGLTLENEEVEMKFDVKANESYTVADEFPRITIENNNYPEITNASYEISVSAIHRFLED